MGLKKLFKPKELNDSAAAEILEKNGVVMKDKSNYHRRKFKFGEFGKFSEQQAQNLDSTPRPILPNSQTGYGNYDNTNNQSDSNQGYGYDEYASGSQGNSNQPNGYSYSYSGGYSNSDYNSRGNGGNTYSSSNNNTNSYGYTGSDDTNGGNSSYSSPTKYNRSKSDRGPTSTTPRRPKQNNYASSNSYSYQTDQNIGSSYTNTNNENNSSSNGYGYEPSINTTSNSNGYGFDPYDDTSVVAKSTEVKPPLTTTKTSNSTVTKSTYDPYAPGEEPYADDAGAGTADSLPATRDPTQKTTTMDDSYNNNSGGYGAYGGYEPDINDYGNNDDNATITGNQTVDGLTAGVQELQLQKEQTQQQEQDFDPYGPSAQLQASTQTQAQTQKLSEQSNTADLDLNAYEPTPEMQQQDTPYDEDEFEEDVDEDEEELNRIQRQTKDVREDTVNLSRTLIDNLGQANVTATNTLGVLGNQREKIYELESNIGTMKVQQRFVDDHVKDLEHYNRSLFHIKVNNPFTRNSRRRAKEQAFLAQKQEDRANKDKLNGELYQSQRAIMDQLKNDNVKSELQEKYDYDRRVKEASKYLTKDHDEEDERMEVEIAANIEHAQKLANNLKKKAQLMNNEIGEQNNNLKQVSENVDYMDDKITMTTRRIRGI